MSSRSLPALIAGAALTAATFTGNATAAAATTATACADAPAAPAAPAVTGAVFNEPVGGDPTAVLGRICALVHQTPAGERIRVAQFVMSGASGRDFANELIKAHRRGVKVQVLVDGDTRGSAVAAQLAAELGTDTSAGSWLHVCSGPPSGGTAACIGNKGQHNKFYLFSRAGGAADVVVQSSANITDLNSTTYWNNAVTITGNRRLYQAYSAYFDDLAAERKTLDYNRVVTTGSAGGSVRAQFFPRADGDPIVEHLDKVSCRDGAAIRVGMSEWDAYRVAIAERLRDMAAQGCSVSVVYGVVDDEVKQVLLSSPRIEVRTLGSGSALPGRIHSKYLLIEGSYDGDSHARRVITGSHNYNETSLRRNDETLLTLNNKAVYAQYRANFETMRTVAPLAQTP
ncbi:phospholipase D-like domain-containing protein [Actinomadura sp. NPDC047616]|uniref:phospholipase D-like domain-containing protein n=1 Tax=Actinomadura sp. NPDC047616 TaxID=3155914 RepID=UPI00340A4BF2